jgi:hypothetical protein
MGNSSGTFINPKKIKNDEIEIIDKDLDLKKNIKNLVKNYDCVIYYFDIANKNNKNLLNKISILKEIVLENKLFIIISDLKYNEIISIINIKNEHYISPYNYEMKYGTIYKLPIGKNNNKNIDFKIPLNQIIEDISNQYGFDFNKIILLSNLGNITNLDLKIGFAYFE